MQGALPRRGPPSPILVGAPCTHSDSCRAIEFEFACRVVRAEGSIVATPLPFYRLILGGAES